MFLKVLNDEKAKALAEKGFTYMTETINKGQVVYIFPLTDELIRAALDIGFLSSSVDF